LEFQIASVNYWRILLQFDVYFYRTGAEQMPAMPVEKLISVTLVKQSQFIYLLSLFFL